MRGIIGSVLLALLLSCSVETPEETEEQKPEVVEEQTPKAPEPAPGEPDRSGCELYGTTEGEVDGKRIPVPVECNPYWMDRGDPPPDEKLNPAKKFANEV